MANKGSLKRKTSKKKYPKGKSVKKKSFGKKTVKHKNDQKEMIEKYKKYITSYKTFKCALNKIIKSNDNIIKINEAVVTVNKIIVHTYNFLKMYYLYKYHNKLQLPVIDGELINCIMKTLCIRNPRGTKPNESTQLVMDELNNFYEQHYKNIMIDGKFSYTHLNTVLDYETISIVTNFKNHITNHFYDFFNRYVNVIIFKKQSEDYIKKNLKDAQLKESLDYYNKNIRLLKSDLYNGTNKCPPFLNPIKNKIRDDIFKFLGYNDSLWELLDKDPLHINKDYSSKIKVNKLKEIFKGSLPVNQLYEDIQIESYKKLCKNVEKKNKTDEEHNQTIDIVQKKIEKNYKQKIAILKNDIINEENNCPLYFNHLKNKINNVKNDIQYKEIIKNFIFKDPLKLFPYMIQMSIEIESYNEKTFGCFPLRTNIRPKYIRLDTTTLVHLLFPENENRQPYLTKGGTKKYEDDIWSKFFRINKKIFKKKKNYKFNHQIETDGFGCSVLLIREDLFNSEKKTKIKTIRKPLGYRPERYVHELTDDEKEKYKNYTLVGIDPNKADLIYATDGKLIPKETKKELRKESNQETKQVNTNKTKKSKDNSLESIFEDKPDTKIINSKKKPHIFRYTNNQRKKESKSKKYKKKFERDKKRTKIEIDKINHIFKSVKELESELCLNNLETEKLKPSQYEYLLERNKNKMDKINDKLYEFCKESTSNKVTFINYTNTCSYENTLKYTKKKNEINNYLYAYYEKKLYRQLNWYSYVNKRKSETKMTNNFKKTFGDNKKVLVCFGDWSQLQTMKFQEPTMGKSIRKLFRDAGYDLFLVDEYNTSKMNYKMNCEMERFKRIESPRPYRKGNYQLCHGLLRSKIFLENNPKRHLLMNRDLNASLNIRYKAECYILKKDLPKCLTRK